MKAKVLVVEDDPTLQALLTYNLTQEYFDTAVAGSGSEAYAMLQANNYDLVILDLVLPGMDGTDLLKAMRYEMNLPVPVIILSARGQLADKLVGLDLGASDYITKPFELSELIARVKAQLAQAERFKMALQDGNACKRRRVTLGKVTVDREARSVMRDGTEIYLRAKEWDLLLFLLEHANTVLTRVEIKDGVWGGDSPTGLKAVDVTMSSLRHKLEDNPASPKHLMTSRNAGYKLQI